MNIGDLVIYTRTDSLLVPEGAIGEIVSFSRGDVVVDFGDYCRLPNSTRVRCSPTNLELIFTT